MTEAIHSPLADSRAPEPGPRGDGRSPVWEAMSARLPVGLFQTDASGACIYVNARWCELTGLASNNALGAGWARALHPDDRERVFAAWTHAANSASGFADEYRFLHPDGAVVWVYGQAAPEVDENGNVVAFVGSVTDITARKRAENALRASEARFRALAGATARAIWTADATGLVLDGPTARWPFLTDLPPQERDREWLAAVHPDDRAPGDAVWRSAIAASQPFVFEQRVRQRDGSYRHFAVRAVPVRAEDGTIREWVGTDIDITERKRAEAALRERDEFLRLTLQAARAGAWAVDLATDRDEWSEEVFPLLGLQPGDVESAFANLLAVVHPDDRAWLAAKANADIAAGREGQSEFRVVWPDGSVHWLLARGRTIDDAAGQRRRVGLFLDITDRKQAEIELRHNEERLQLGIEVAGFALAEIDYARDVIHLSAEAARLYGLGHEAVTLPREQVHNAFHPDDRDDLRRRIAVTPDPDAEPSFTTEYRVRWPNGEVRWLSVRKQIIFDRTGAEPRPVRAMLAALDVTARVRAEEDRRALLDALAHDLKNPLTAIKAQAQLLLRQIDRKGVPDRVALAERVASFAGLATHMTELIDDLDEHARVALGVGLAPDRRPTDLVVLARAAVDETARTGGRHTVRLETADTEVIGNWDEGQIRRVLDNLLGNAVKYSPAGSDIAVHVGRDGRHAALRVRDEGIGIPPADLPHVFAFRRRGGNVGAIAGSGVGLAGVKQIVEQHGGSVTVQSEEHRGSTFTVRLPLSGRST